MKINDGSGGDNAAKVKDNRLYVNAVSRATMTDKSEDGDTYGINLPLRTQTTTGGRQLFLKNTSSTKNMHIVDFYVYYDGGATNFNRPMEVELYFGDGAPSGNNTVSAGGNLNLTSSNTPDLTVEYWDEVSNGMTVAAGTLALSGVVGQGMTRLAVDGAIILGKNDTLGLNFKASEIGEAGCNILVYFD